MKSNTKYTVEEFLKEAGIKDLKKLGKVKVIIGGIRGIVSKDQILAIPKGVKTVDIVYGGKPYTIEIKGKGNGEMSEKAVKGHKAKK